MDTRGRIMLEYRLTDGGLHALHFYTHVAEEGKVTQSHYPHSDTQKQKQF